MNGSSKRVLITEEDFNKKSTSHTVVVVVVVEIRSPPPPHCFCLSANMFSDFCIRQVPSSWPVLVFSCLIYHPSHFHRGLFRLYWMLLDGYTITTPRPSPALRLDAFRNPNPLKEYQLIVDFQHTQVNILLQSSLISKK